ncbi:MAG: helix-turn-helix domain-containing protein [Gammaproteobacteria bacterium]|nr:helix-turn-helix domain-containing protein [Gammaproteobacteria bacterium]MDH3751865.1 helix-turn-helix domain-containing protein [Gammaproteobacteria bacterium]
MQQHEIYERARLSRDARFDGQFFVGVKTTGIYCRPICPAVAPKSENVTFYPSSAAACEAGFRPCLRCRPECAPGTPAWSGTSTTVRRGLRLISGGALDDGSIEQLAERLGVTSRHLRRLFTQHLGASPLAVAHTQRLHFAKRLIDQTNLPLSHVATAAGYGSVRRFNDTFKKTYGRSPRDLRRRREESFDRDSALSVRLPYRRPFDWPAMLEFLRGRATPGVEQVIDGSYLRTVLIDDHPGVIECRHDEADGSICLSLHGIATPGMFQVVQRVREMLDLDAPLADIADTLATDKQLDKLLQQNAGIRVPGAWDGFELTVRAILGQQVSVKAATTLVGRVAQRYGKPVDLPASLAGRADGMSLVRVFPSPQELARARCNDMGLVKSRADTIRRVSSAVIHGDINFDSAQDPDEFCKKLMSIRGIGEWTAQYVAMRALKYPDAFPASDLGLLKAMQGVGKINAAELTRRAESWRPWRAYAALLLWSSLSGSGG